MSVEHHTLSGIQTEVNTFLGTNILEDFLACHSPQLPSGGFLMSDTHSGQKAIRGTRLFDDMLDVAFLVDSFSRLIRGGAFKLYRSRAQRAKRITCGGNVGHIEPSSMRKPKVMRSTPYKMFSIDQL
jgi:hypothetical protein